MSLGEYLKRPAALDLELGVLHKPVETAFLIRARSCDQASQEKNLQEVIDATVYCGHGDGCADFPQVQRAECGPELL